MRRHDHLRTGVDTSLEGDQLVLLELLIGFVDRGQTGMAVGAGVAVSGEVLQGRDDARIVERLDKNAAVLGDGLRVVGKGTNTDDRVGRIVVHVHVGREIRVEADGSELLAHHLGDFLRDAQVVDRAERHVARGHGSLRQTGDVAAFLIGGDDQLRTVAACGVRLLQLVNEPRRAGVGRRVLQEQDHACIAVFVQRICDVLRDLRHLGSGAFRVHLPAERRHDHHADLVLRRHGSQILFRRALLCRDRHDRRRHAEQQHDKHQRKNSFFHQNTSE